MSFNDKLVQIAEDWQEQEGASAIDVEAVADYALKHKLYDRPLQTKRELCIRDVRRALQHATHVDAQGMVLRSKRAFRLLLHRRRRRPMEFQPQGK